jgi:hypothetical protein
VTLDTAFSLTVAAAAYSTGRSRATIRCWASSGALPFVRHPTRHALLFRPVDVERLDASRPRKRTDADLDRSCADSDAATGRTDRAPASPSRCPRLRDRFLARGEPCATVTVPARSRVREQPTTWLEFHGTLHPSTEPEMIRASQQADVAEYLAAHPHATVEEIGAALVLPVWNVTRALAALRGESEPSPVPQKALGRTKGRRGDGSVRKTRELVA